MKNQKQNMLLFLKTYDLELEQAADYRLWTYRKAAWTVDELPEPIDAIYETGGRAGLQALSGIGKSIAAQIATWLREEKSLRRAHPAAQLG